MATILQIKRRAAAGAAGAPTTLATAELAYNMADGKVYIGYGDNGSGVATSIRTVAKDDFTYNIPAGGSTGDALKRAASGGVEWGTAGAVYTASGDGIELTANNFALNYTEIATGISLGNYALTANVVLKAGSTMTGKLVTATPAIGGAGLNLPHGVAPTTPVAGDIWTTTTSILAHINTTTKTVAFTDSATTGNTTGSAATLTNPRSFSITGGGISATGINFDGSAAVALNASVDAGHITLARMANLAANSFIGNNTGSAATPIALTVAQAKSLLAVSFTDISGTASTGQIPALDATKITSGVFDVARIPVLPGNTTIVSSGAISDLTAGQQTNIETGTIVTTTDGRRWVYNTGSKILEASYVELADVTPEWSIIANKPTFATVATSGAYADLSGKPVLATVATSGAYADLSGKPTLGTMASQNANAVAITGGTIDGVTLDGGTF